MAQITLNVGSNANDGTGDSLRIGGDKVNDNFVEIYTKLGDGSTLTTDTVTLLTATQTLTNKTLTAPTITGAGAIAGTFTGDITGDVTGNVTGNVTGDLTGDVTGDLTGDVTGAVTGNVTGDLTGDVTGDVTGNISTTTGNIVATPATNILEVQGDGASIVGQLQLNCHVNSHGQIIASQPHSAAATNTLTLPGGTTIGNTDATLVSDTGTQTLTNKSIDLTDNTITGTTAEFNTALSDGSFATLAGTETLTNKSLTSPTITGTGTAVFTSVDTQVILSEASQTGDGSTTLVVDPTIGLTLLTSSASAETASLADGTTVGQTVNIILQVDGGGDVVLTPATFLNGSTITFADAADQVTLVWTGTNGWAMVGAGYGAPAIA